MSVKGMLMHDENNPMPENDSEVRVAVEFPGPFDHHDVVVNGWRVPFLDATPLNGGKVLLGLDRRTSVELPVADVDRIVPFIADCIAVAMGYTAHPGCDGLDEPRPSHPMARVRWV